MWSHIVTIYELWILYVTSMWKEDTQVWHKKKRVRDEKSICTQFWDYQCVLFVNFQECGNKARMNSKKYMEIFEDLKNFKRKRPGLLSSRVILQHDNTTLHLSKTTPAKITTFSWFIFLHPANSLPVWCHQTTASFQN